MRATPWVVVLLALGMVLPSLGAVSAKSTIGVGDYWEYDFNADLNDAGATLNDTSLIGFPSLNVSGIVRLAIVDNMTLFPECSCIGGSQRETLIGKLNLSAPIRALGITVGVISINVTTNFDRPTFDIQSFHMGMNMSIGIPGSGNQTHYSLERISGISPAFDFYAGNHDTKSGSSWTSNSSLRTTQWVNGVGRNDTYPLTTEHVLSTFKIVKTGVRVTVPAGTFSCSKIEVGGSSGSTPFYLYYSDKAHFYVKMSYTNNSGSMTVSLRSYSSSGGSARTQSVAVMVGTIAVIMVAAVVIMLLLLRRRGGKVPVQSAPPAQSGHGQQGPPPEWPPPNQPGPRGPLGPPVGGARQ